MREQTEFHELMEEPPGGFNAGSAASTNPNLEGRHVVLGVDEAQAHEFLQGGGWGIVETSRGSGGYAAHGAGDAGMSAHRGVLAGDEYVDLEVLRSAIEAELGFTIQQVQSVYRQGPMSAEQRELRGQIDARLLALSRSGGNLLALARVFGLRVEPARDEGGETCWTLKRAIARAKAAELLHEGSAE